ncbi:MAG: hypothetical protein ACREGJ_04290 [Candidatus Saccharimonadales bacterium]
MKSQIKSRPAALLHFINVALLVWLGMLAFIDLHLAARIAAYVGLLELAVLLIPPRLLGVQRLDRWQPKLMLVAPLGKWLGLWTTFWLVMHATVSSFAYFDAFVLGAHLLRPEIILGTLSLIIFLGLALISNKWSYAHIKWWKHLNMLVWLAVPFAFVHSLLAAAEHLGAGPFVLVPWLLLAIAVAGAAGLLRAKRDYFARHRVGLLVLGSTVAMLVAIL